MNENRDEIVIKKDNAPARLSTRLVNIYLAGYALDAACSLIVFGAFGADAGESLPGRIQAALAAWVYVMTFLVLGLVAFRPRLPLLPLLALCASALWLGTGAAPIPLWIVPGQGLALFLAALQLAIAFGAFAWLRKRNRGDGFWLREPSIAADLQVAPRLFRFALIAIGIGLPLTLAYGALSFATWIAVETEHFVTLDLRGIELADRRYTRGDREVRLVGMMHLGEEATYREITRSFLGAETIVLEEGVSDKDAVLENGLRYDKLAAELGLSAQRSLASYLEDHYAANPEAVEPGERPLLRNADVDTSAFAPATHRVLARAARIWSGDDFLTAFTELYVFLLENPEATETFYRDIIDRRNDHLMAQMDLALEQARRVIVPWGALHLPGIEQFVLELGFEQVSEARRHVVAWPTVLAALSAS